MWSYKYELRRSESLAEFRVTNESFSFFLCCHIHDDDNNNKDDDDDNVSNNGSCNNDNKKCYAENLLSHQLEGLVS